MKKINDGSQSTLSLRTSHIIGREDILDNINKAISDKSGQSHVLYLEGPGGMGKTRILQEVGNIQKQITGKKFLWSGIIDLYHEENHSPENLQKAIAQGLDTNNKYFVKFHKLRKELQEKQQQGFSGPILEKLRRDVNEQFLAEYNALAAKQRLVLCFDTVELIQYESDVVQHICQVEDEDTVIKNWLANHVSQFPNTVTLFAGRSHPKVEKDFKNTFINLNYNKYFLESLTEDESRAYLDALVESGSRHLDQGEREWIIDVAGGKPIRLTLCVDLFFGESRNVNELPKKENIDADLVHALEERDLIFRYLIGARKGLDSNLLRHLTHWSDKQIQTAFDKIRNLDIIKVRPGSTKFFLHDEIYDAVDKYLSDTPRYGPEYLSQVTEYYQEKLRTVTFTEREDTIAALLYYRFQVNAATGYSHYYARFDEDAIKSHETGFDMRVRDEVLRFINRYADPDSDFYSEQIAKNIDRSAIDRDCAVRWVKRYLARGQFKKALQIANNIRNSSDPNFNWDSIEDPIFKAGLLTARAEAMIYTGVKENEIRETLQEAIQYLEKDQQWDEDQRWWRSRILGRVYDRLGYSHRTLGRYGLALEQYKRALPFFTDENILDERANTLNNLAFLLALLGRVRLARTHVDQALKIRKQLGRKYPIALSINTRGLVHVLEDHPMWGERDCREALKVCEELGDSRGIGLAHLGLGLALRKRGNQWKMDVYSQKDAEGFLRGAEEHLQQGVKIFSGVVPESIRLWEAYNELGSLYCDWAWLTRRRMGRNWEEIALQQYDQSLEYQREALKVAETYNPAFQVADSYDDLAQAHADRSFLLSELGRLAEAEDGLRTASACLDQILKIVPAGYRLAKGRGFGTAAEPGDAYWLSLGKLYLQRGIWNFEQVKHETISETTRDERLREGIRYFALSSAYFHQYWPQSYAFETGLNACATRIQRAGVPADTAKAIARETAQEYAVNLDPLLETIENVMGI